LEKDEGRISKKEGKSLLLDDKRGKKRTNPTNPQLREKGIIATLKVPYIVPKIHNWRANKKSNKRRKAHFSRQEQAY